MGGRNRLDFGVKDQNLLDSSVGIGIALVSSGDRKWVGLEWGSKLPWFLCQGVPKLT